MLAALLEHASFLVLLRIDTLCASFVLSDK